MMFVCRRQILGACLLYRGRKENERTKAEIRKYDYEHPIRDGIRRFPFFLEYFYIIVFRKIVKTM